LIINVRKSEESKQGKIEINSSIEGLFDDFDYKVGSFYVKTSSKR